MCCLPPNLLAKMWECFWQQVYWVSPNLPADMDAISTDKFPDSHQICQQNGGGYFCQQIYWLSPNLPEQMGRVILLADLLTISLILAADLFPLQCLCQITCLNVILLYFSPFKYMYTVPNAKSVLFTQISYSYLVCCNKLKFPSKNWKCCA